MPSLLQHRQGEPREVALSEDDALPALLALVRGGDRPALAAIYDRFGSDAYSAAFRITRSREDAEDAVQETFVRLAGALRSYTGGSPSFGPWLRRVAVRQALMLLRSGRRRREADVADVMSLVAAPSAVHGALDRLSMDAALARLSEEQRTVFLLKEVEGYAHAEIAELLDISVAASEVRLHRARRQLRELLRGSR